MFSHSNQMRFQRKQEEVFLMNTDTIFRSYHPRDIDTENSALIVVVVTRKNRIKMFSFLLNRFQSADAFPDSIMRELFQRQGNLIGKIHHAEYWVGNGGKQFSIFRSTADQASGASRVGAASNYA